MPSRRHANAKTTPEMREFIRKSDLSVAALAKLLNISETTVRKWKNRASVEDASHKPLKLNTRLSPIQEYVVVELRKTLLLSLDELLGVTHNYINADVSRAGLARCLKRYGVSRLDGIQDDGSLALDGDEMVHLSIEHMPTQTAIAPEISTQALASVLSKVSHREGSQADSNQQADNQVDNHDKQVDVVNVRSIRLPKLTQDQSESGLFFAFDPQTRWVYVDIYQDGPLDASRRYISYALRRAPFPVARKLADNYNEFMQHYRLAGEQQAPQETTNAVHSELSHKPKIS